MKTAEHQHKTLTAETTATDTEQGTFTALVSAWNVDREKDVITKTAFDRTIEAWQRSGKNLPLLFEHSSTVIGAIDPHTMHATEQGLVVAGEVDRSTEKGLQVWKTIKSGTAGFSIGFMSESRPRKGGGRELTEIDLFEVSATSTPMHPATKALSWKAVDPPTAMDFKMPTDAEIRERAAVLDAEQKKLERAEKAARAAVPPKVKTFEV